MAFRRVKMIFGNIETAVMTDKWPNGRPFKHGAMKINFGFHPGSFVAACDEVESFMAEKGYQRGRDYHIPAWNRLGKYSKSEHIRDEFYITFDSDETFVMAKLAWDLQDDNSIPE